MAKFYVVENDCDGFPKQVKEFFKLKLAELFCQQIAKENGMKMEEGDIGCFYGRDDYDRSGVWIVKKK